MEEHNNFFEEIFENAPEGIVISDSKGIVMDCNTAFSKFVGYNKKELLGKSYTIFTPEKYLAKEHKEIGVTGTENTSETMREYLKKTGESVFGKVKFWIKYKNNKLKYTVAYVYIAE